MKSMLADTKNVQFLGKHIYEPRTRKQDLDIANKRNGSKNHSTALNYAP